MPRQIRLRPAAEADLEGIWDYSVARWSQAQAVIYLSGLDAVLNLLAEFPDIARLRPEFRPPVRIHPYRKHVVIFQQDEAVIDVLRVVHRRTNWSDFLSE